MPDAIMDSALRAEDEYRATLADTRECANCRTRTMTVLSRNANGTTWRCEHCGRQYTERRRDAPRMRDDKRCPVCHYPMTQRGATIKCEHLDLHYIIGGA